MIRFCYFLFIYYLVMNIVFSECSITIINDEVDLRGFHA